MKPLKIRPRRLRENPLVRSFVSENSILAKDLIQPIFIKEGLTKPVEIASMPGQFQQTLASAVTEAKILEKLGVSGVILFGIPTKKDLNGRAAFAGNGITQKAIAQIKKAAPKLLVIADVCLCEYLSHGHCGIIKNKSVQNDETLDVLAKVAISYARAGADIVAPSDMMDGRVAAIREALDKNNFKNVPILSYAVKYASSFYAPFRDAAESAPAFGDRKSYQMNPANIREALKEAALDVAEGADMLLVKPALTYGDILSKLQEKYSIPVGAYSVSGEYAMIKAAVVMGWLDEQKTVLETHLSLKRAGADFIVTYWAKDIAKWGVGL